MQRLITFSPAKVNLFLAVLGKRSDGFHSLFSLVAPVDFGDYLTLMFGGKGDELICSRPEIPTDGNNLILKALKLFREYYACPPVKIVLEKNIPTGAGLGGGSSNGTTFLKALNAFFRFPLSNDTICSLTAQLGSDCTLFCHNEPTFLSGRGEIVAPANIEIQKRLRGQRLLIFKPKFDISTPWAYTTKTKKKAYCSAEVLQNLQKKVFSGEWFYLNSMESVVFGRYPALKALQSKLVKEFNFHAMLSGSGSSFFGFLDKSHQLQEIRACLFDCLGKDIFIVETFIK